jgi:hypothetical protein
MIITLMFIGFIIVGIILLTTSKSDKINIGWSKRDACEFIGMLLIVMGIVAGLFTCGFAISNAVTYDLNYQNALHEKEMLEYRIEHMEENITGNEMLYNDIVEFNNELRNVKKWANNPWTNWFNNQGVASIDYIELGMD